MRLNPNVPNRLRSLFGTIAFLSLLVAGLAYGATWVARTGLERDAVAQAGRAAGAVVEPELRRDDVRAPMSGERYAELRTLIDKRIVNPPVTSVEIWNEDGAIVYAGRRSRLGETVPAMRDVVRETLTRGSMKLVEGDTLRALAALRLPAAAVVVEVDRSYAGLVAEANERWQPWVRRGVTLAAIALVLYVLAVGVSLVERRRRASAAERLPEPVRTGNAQPPPAEEDSHLAIRRRRADPDEVKPDAPAYMQPGFREHLQARREAEEALIAAQQALGTAEQDRQRLQERLRQTEAELEDARRRLTELGATAGR
jgi:hypothetical protein